MPPQLALFLWFVLLVALLCFDPAKDSRVSSALWVPVTWMFIIGTRLPSQWLGSQIGVSAQALEDGNPIDRSINSLLILMALCVLLWRPFRWGDFLSRNKALFCFLVFSLVSACWSDFPLISLKRWFRDFGNYLMVLVPLTDPLPAEAIGTLLRRVSYLIIPLSVTLIKYFPQLAKHYDNWTGLATFAGATTSKNMLGVTCLISGIYFFWDVVVRWPHRRNRSAKHILYVDYVLLAMTLWLLHISSSATATVCLALGAGVILMAQSGLMRRHPGLLKTAIPACFILYVILAYGLDLNGQLAGAIGKDPTLTDRTKIWGTLLGMHINPLLGTGYETFWLGSRLDYLWKLGLGQINEAHNGFLELYLNLGLVGVAFLIAFIVGSYQTICTRLKPFSNLGSLTLAIWIAMLFHSMTEASFRSGLMWFTFLLGSIALRKMAVPQPRPVVFEQPPTHVALESPSRLPSFTIEAHFPNSSSSSFET